MHGDPVGTISSVVVLAHKYSKIKNKADYLQVLRAETDVLVPSPPNLILGHKIQLSIVSISIVI